MDKVIVNAYKDRTKEMKMKRFRVSVVRYGKVVSSVELSARDPVNALELASVGHNKQNIIIINEI